MHGHMSDSFYLKYSKNALMYIFPEQTPNAVK